MRRARNTEKRERTPRIRARRGVYGSKKINRSPLMARNPTHWTGPNDHPAVATATTKDSPRISQPTIFSISRIRDGFEGRDDCPRMA